MGSFEAASAHMSGLKHMCSLRGGLEALSHSPMLQRTVTWCDFAYSTAFCRPLIFPLLPNLCHTFPLLNRFLGIGDFPSPPESENPAAWPGGLELNDPEAIDFLETLAVVAERINDFDRRAEREGWAYRGAGGKDAVWRERRKEVSDAIYLLEYRLCTMEARTNWGGGSPWDMQLAGPPGTTAPSDDLSMTHIFDFSLPAHMAHKHSVGGELPLDPELLRVGEREPLVASSVQIPLHPPQHPQTTTDLSPALKWAVHLFLHIAIRGQPPAAKRHRTMCERMMGAIWPVLGRLDLLVDSYPFGAEKGTYDPESGISSADYVEMRSMAAASQLDMHSCILAWILFVGCCIRDPLTHSYPLFQSQSHLRPPIYTVPSSPSVGLAASGSGQAQSSASSLHYPQPPVTPVDAVPQTYRDLFLPLLRRLCERRGIITKPALETVLARVVWYEKLDWSKRQVYMLWGDLGVGMGYATEIFEGV